MEIAVTRQSAPKGTAAIQRSNTSGQRSEANIDDARAVGVHRVGAAGQRPGGMKFITLTPRLSNPTRRSPARSHLNDASVVNALGLDSEGVRGEVIGTDSGAELYGDMGEAPDDADADVLEVAAAASSVARPVMGMPMGMRDVKVEVLGGSALDANASGIQEDSEQEADADPDADLDEDELDDSAGDHGDMKEKFEDVKMLDDRMNEALADESAMLARFACAECGMKFARHSAMRQHARKMHATRIGVQCEVCGKAFRYLGSLPRHMLLHASIKPFSCAVCGAQFAQKGDLQRHDRLHTGERPFACSECSATFNREYSLKKHIRVHTGERPYACPVCERRFASRSSVTRHSHTHAPRAGHGHAHPHASYSPGAYAAAAYQVDPVDQVDQPDDFEQPDANEIELAAENVEEDEVDEAQVELVANIAQQAAASTSGESKRRRKDARSHVGRSHVAPPDEADNESLEHAWLLTTR